MKYFVIIILFVLYTFPVFPENTAVDNKVPVSKIHLNTKETFEKIKKPLCKCLIYQYTFNFFPKKEEFQNITNKKLKLSK